MGIEDFRSEPCLVVPLFLLSFRISLSFFNRRSKVLALICCSCFFTSVVVEISLHLSKASSSGTSCCFKRTPQGYSKSVQSFITTAYVRGEYFLFLFFLPSRATWLLSYAVFCLKKDYLLN